MIILDYLSLVRKHLFYVLKMSWTMYTKHRAAVKHKKTYQLAPESKTVIVIGGSYAGIFLSRRLAETLPPGWRVTLIERNSHFNHTFNFPRYSVYQGKEYQAFIPFEGAFTNAPDGILDRVVGEVKAVREGEVELSDGRKFTWEVLAFATGATQPPPARLLSREKAGACEELRALQSRIQESKSIAIVGAGAVGVQIAADIKTFLPDKRVVLIHSRQQLLPSFGPKLSNYVIEKLKALGVELILGERPVLSKETNWESRTMEFRDGRQETFDVVIPCTGQIPNSSIVAGISPTSISPETGRVLVKPTLELQDGLKESDTIKNVFSLGDVAETGGPKMARAGIMQAELVCGNILAQIEGKPMEKYVPVWAMEGILKLTLGRHENVTYVPDDDNGGYLFPGKSTDDNLEVAKMWYMLGGDMSKAAEVD